MPSDSDNVDHDQGGGGSVDLFGSANIEGWLQLQLSKKVLYLPTSFNNKQFPLYVHEELSLSCLSNFGFNELYEYV